MRGVKAEHPVRAAIFANEERSEAKRAARMRPEFCFSKNTYGVSENFPFLFFFYLYSNSEAMETRRQKKVNSLLQETLSEIFQKYGPEFFGSAFVTITEVSITPDLLTAKIFISIFNVKDKDAVIDQIRSHTHEIRKRVGNKMRHHLRRIPELLFYLDESLDNAIRIEELLKDIKKEK